MAEARRYFRKFAHGIPNMLGTERIALLGAQHLQALGDFVETKSVRDGCLDGNDAAGFQAEDLFEIVRVRAETAGDGELVEREDCLRKIDAGRNQ